MEKKITLQEYIANKTTESKTMIAGFKRGLEIAFKKTPIIMTMAEFDTALKTYKTKESK